jgi:hypothetical protein
MLRASSKLLLCSSYAILNSVVYLCAKFGALNQRINEIRSSGKVGNLVQPVPLVQISRFSIQTIFWLSDLVAIFLRASGTIIDSSLYVSSHLHASQL